MIAYRDNDAADARPLCNACRRPKRPDCDGQGWLEALGPYRDGSYITSRPCPNENPLAAD